MTASIFAIGVALFIYDFFRRAPRLGDEVSEPAAGEPRAVPSTL